MWLTQKEFKNERIEKDLNYLALLNYKEIDDGSHYIDFEAIQRARRRYYRSLKKINETQPYPELYFFKVDKGEGDNYFDKVIEYNTYRLLHYKENFEWAKSFCKWNAAWKFYFKDGYFLIAFALPEDFDLISLMGILDEYHSNDDLSLEDFRTKLNSFINSNQGVEA